MNEIKRNEFFETGKCVCQVKIDANGPQKC